jgi:hypothetical protein
MTFRFGGQGSANLSTFFRNLAVLAFVVTLGTASASAEVAIEAFTFTGECTDCTGTASGTLFLLGGYELGTPLSADDLYSFNYMSNLTDISIHSDPTEVLSGTLPVGLGPIYLFRATTAMSHSVPTLTEHGRPSIRPPISVRVAFGPRGLRLRHLSLRRCRWLGSLWLELSFCAGGGCKPRSSFRKLRRCW